jgi:hypothetical protein
MGQGKRFGHAGCVQQNPASGWHLTLRARPHRLVVGALLVLVACPANALSFECLPSADAVRQQHPDAWPSWTLRAPGHEGTKCWYAATRSTTHQLPKRIAEPGPAATLDDFDNRVGTAEVKPPLPAESLTPPLGADTPTTIPFTTAIATAAISYDREPIGTIARNATSTAFSVSGGELDQPVTDLRQNELPLRYEPMRVTDQAFSIPALLAALGGALLFASMIAALLATLPTGRRYPIGRKQGIPSPAGDDLLHGIGSSAEANLGQRRRKSAILCLA